MDSSAIFDDPEIIKTLLTIIICGITAMLIIALWPKMRIAAGTERAAGTKHAAGTQRLAREATLLAGLLFIAAWYIAITTIIVMFRTAFGTDDAANEPPATNTDATAVSTTSSATNAPAQ